MTQESSTVFLHKKLSSHQTFLQQEAKIHKFFIRILFCFVLGSELVLREHACEGSVGRKVLRLKP